MTAKRPQTNLDVPRPSEKYMIYKRKIIKALLLFSGGLDSILAAKILEKQGIKVTALTFVSYFFDAEQAKMSAKESKIKLRIENFSNEHFEIIKNPKFGRGAGMNPCIDCHLLMLKEAKKIALRVASKEDLILVTGSLFVVGEFRDAYR